MIGGELLEMDLVAIDDILKKSVEKAYRIVDTIAAVFDSPLIRAE
ncbi:hypothetical protein OAM04_00160 [bacterium]|nr:hypothetical protein [Verrucomicrobiales bacterium]MDC0311615.1 hypothetical protein [bacterium]